MEAAGSIVGLLAIGYKIYKSLDEFVSSCKDAPTIAKDTRDQVYDFRYSLQKLAPYIRETAEITSLGRSNTDINHLKITLASSVDTFSQTQRLLDRLSPRRQEKMDYLGRIRWARAEGNLSKLLSRIEKHKTALILLLTIWTSESSAKTENCVDRLNDLLTSIVAPGGVLEAPPLPCDPSTDALPLNNDGGHTSTQEIRRGFASADSDSVSNLSTTRSLGGRSRRDFESILIKSRAYGNPDIIGDSRFSVSTSQRHTHWSLFSGGSNTSVFSLCYTGFENFGRTLAEERDLSQIPLALHIGSLHNRSWYPPSGNSVKSDHKLTPQPLKTLTSFLSRPTKGMRSMDDRARQTAHLGVGEGLAFMVDELYRSSGSCEDVTICSGKHIQEACLEGDLCKMEMLFAWEAEMMRVHPEWKPKRSASRYIWETVEGESVLGFAIKECDSGMVEMILDRGADVNHFIVDRPMALELAIKTGNAAIVQLLLDRGADINLCSQPRFIDLLLIAIWSVNRSMLEAILDQGINVNDPSRRCSIALFAAIMTNNIPVVQIILDYGVVDVNESCIGDSTPLHLAIQAKRSAIVKALLDKGADVNVYSTSKPIMPLFMAINAENEEMVKMILDRGADINHRFLYQPTALQVAIKNENVAIVQLLVNRGADINRCSNSALSMLAHMIDLSEHVVRI